MRRIPPEPATAVGQGPGEAIPIASSYGIRAAAALTGIDEHTLRMWERRYGFPRPERSAAGARLYTRADLRRLQRIGEALQRGHRPGEVVALTEAALDDLLASAPVGASPPPAPLAGVPDLEAVTAALAREDVPQVRARLRQLALLCGPRRFVADVAHPLAVRIGELWAAGAIEVHQEHLMSDCLSTQLRLLRSLHEDGAGPVVVLATLPGEPHGLGLEMVALYLATMAVNPRVVGLATPADQIVRAAHAHGAAAVGIAIMPSFDLATAERELTRIAPALPPGTALWLGGAGAGQLPPIAGARIIPDFATLERARLALG
jgi:DNA-binding transcriptional MerR regulator